MVSCNLLEQSTWHNSWCKRYQTLFKCSCSKFLIKNWKRFEQVSCTKHSAMLVRVNAASVAPECCHKLAQEPWSTIAQELQKWNRLYFLLSISSFSIAAKNVTIGSSIWEISSMKEFKKSFFFRFSQKLRQLLNRSISKSNHKLKKSIGAFDFCKKRLIR